MNPRTLRRVLVTLVAALGLTALALFGTSASSAQEAAAGTEEPAAEATSSAASDSPAPKASSTSDSSSSDATSTEGSESSASHNDGPTAADANVSGPAEWEMDGEAALDDPTLLPGDPVPEADPGTGVTPRYKVDETDDPASPNRLRLEIDDDPKVVAPGEWLDWWITVTNIGTAPATGIQVTDYVPSNVYFDPAGTANDFELSFAGSSQGDIDASDWNCGLNHANGTATCNQVVGSQLDPGQWVQFLAEGRVVPWADPGDVVANVVEVDWNENPDPFPLSVVEITPIVEGERVEVARILPVTGSDSTFSLLFAGLGLLGAGGLGLGFASRKRS